MKDERLTGDEYDALEHIRRGAKGTGVNACIGRNSKRLTGLKLVKAERDNKLRLTDKGVEALFLRRCITALQALEIGPAAIEPDVAHFLLRKSHIAEADGGQYTLTDKGRESLADILGQR